MIAHNAIKQNVNLLQFIKLHHRWENSITLIFPKAEAWIRQVKVWGLRWSKTPGYWNVGQVRGGKGQMNRVTLISHQMKKRIEDYLEAYKPNYWFFEGANRNQYSGTSVGLVVKKTARRAGIKQTVTPHMLRHSFATHIMDQQIDTRQIQVLLGHNSIKTTAIYTHVSQKDLQKIISPLDHLKDVYS